MAYQAYPKALYRMETDGLHTLNIPDATQEIPRAEDGWFPDPDTAVLNRPGSQHPLSILRGTLDFGYAASGEGDTAAITFIAPWIKNSSVIICQIGDSCDPDHNDEDAVIEGITAHAINIVPGNQFDVMAYAPEGTWGRYRIMVMGN